MRKFGKLLRHNVLGVNKCKLYLYKYDYEMYATYGRVGDTARLPICIATCPRDNLY